MLTVKGLLEAVCCCLAGGEWVADSRGSCGMATVPREGTEKEHGHCGGTMVAGVAFAWCKHPVVSQQQSVSHCHHSRKKSGHERKMKSLGKYFTRGRKRREKRKRCLEGQISWQVLQLVISNLTKMFALRWG